MKRFAFLFLTVVFFLFAFVKENPCEVTYVYDGDTFSCRLENGKEIKVRLIGIDTPEVHENRRAYGQTRYFGSLDEVLSWGREAKYFVEELLKLYKIVYLELDVQKTDKYGRILAYVWLPDGTMLNELLLREGYAMLLTIPPNVKYVEKFKKAVEGAREEGKGIWETIRKNEVAKRCSRKRYCSEMTSCREAMFYYRECGLDYLDGDGDGIPCENVCGGWRWRR